MNAIEALRKIANDDGCGCLPTCTCNNEDSLRIWKQEVQSIAREALSTPPSDADAKVKAYQKELDECEQIAGKALGYPWYKDDQKNFPGATEANGVCIGEHVTVTIVSELANKYSALARPSSAGEKDGTK